ncbi:MAG: RDD family protein [Actinomycetia bacterium]|nr:RDD family protein [Actinomycetes bacterium]
MTGRRKPDDESLPCAIDISYLRSEQRQLLGTVLRAGEVPFGIVRNELIADGSFTDEVERAIAWVVAPERVEAPELDDPEYRGTLPPLVKPSRPPLPDGRRPATRYRRLVAGLIDEVLVGVPTGLAARAEAAPSLIMAVHMFYFVVPTALFGWSIGKLICHTRVIGARSHRTPAPWRVVLRWVIPYAPVILALTVGLGGDVMGLAIAFVYLPIMLDLRGWHDRAAGTLVVEARRTT